MGIHDEGVDTEHPIVPPTPIDTYTKWSVGVVGAALISGAAFFAIRDRTSVDIQFAKQQSAIESTNITVQAHEAQLQVIKMRQDRVLSDLVEINRKLDISAEMQTKLLIELRKK